MKQTLPATRERKERREDVFYFAISEVFRGWIVLVCFVYFAVASRSVFAAVELRVGNVFAVPGSTAFVPVRYTSDTNLVAAQFDLVFGNTNLVSGDATGGIALADHRVTTGTPQSGACRVVIYSPTNAAFANGTLVRIPLTVASNMDYEPIPLTLANIVLVNYDDALVTNVSSVAGTLTCTNAEVAPPIITVQPSGQVAWLGKTISLQVIATGSEPLTYQWRRDATNVSDGARISGANTAILTVTKAQFSDMGVYSVVVANAADSETSCNTTLSVVNVAAWGRSSEGQTDVPAGLTNAVAVAAGWYHSLALRNDGTVIGWGDNSLGQISIPPALSNVVAIASGNAHSLALKADGMVVAWGDNYSGRATVPPGLSNVVQISASTFNLALRADGTVAAWGDNSYGQTNVPPGLGDVVAVAAGWESGLALKTDGTLAAWGDNTYGQTNIPPSLTNVVAIGAAGWHNLAVKRDGTVVVWGNAFFDVTVIPASATNAVAVAGGGNHCLALRADGAVVAWGADDLGQGSVPAGLTNGVAIDSRWYHNVALVGNVPPWVAAPLVNRTGYPGAPVSLRARVTGTRPLDYQWLFNGTNLIAGATNTTLMLSNVWSYNAGNYSVVVSNAFGAVTSAVVSLTVAQPLVLSAQGRGTVAKSPDLATYDIGQTVTLTATPSRWHQFTRWSDGYTNFVRTITIGLTNRYLAIFTNTVPLEELVFKQWDKSFGGSGNDFLSDICPLPDGRILLGGYGTSRLGGNKTNEGFYVQDIWLVMLDAEGSKLWERSFGGGLSDSLYSLQQTRDGGFILGGSSDSEPSDVFGNKRSPHYGAGDYWVIRLDGEGNIIWERTFGGTARDGPAKAVETSDGGFIVVGTSWSDPGGNKTSTFYGLYDGWVVRLDANGNKLWEQSYGTVDPDSLFEVVQLPDGGFLLGGTSDPGYWLIHVGPNGNKLWEGRWGGSADEGLASLQLTADGGVALGGRSASGTGGDKTAPAYGSSDYWLVRLDANLNKLWDQSYGGTNYDQATSLCPMPDGGFLLGGQSDSGPSGNKTSPNFGQLDYWLVRVDASGNKLWERSFGGTDIELNNEVNPSIRLTPDGGVVIGCTSGSGADGNKTSPQFGAGDYWVVKLALYDFPVGTPQIYVNDQFTFGGSLTFPATNVVQVTMETTFPNGSIFYTLDGSPPDPGSAAYDGTPIVLTNSTVIRAVAFDQDFIQSSEADPVTIIFIPLYTLTAGTPGGGSVTVNPPGGPYLSNSVVTLTATPSNGWVFLSWSGDSTDTNPVVNLTLNISMSVQAIFGTVLSNTIAPSSYGSILRQPDLPFYPYGTTVRLSAVPLAGKYFSRWNGAGTGLSNSPINYPITLPNTNVGALFAGLTGSNRSLTVLMNGQGEVTKTPQLAYYANGSSVTLTAVADANSAFVGWSGDVTATNNPLTVVMNTNKLVTASFTMIPTVVLTSPTNGAFFTLPAEIEITANANDFDGAISRVEFYANGVLLGTRTNAPFRLPWNIPFWGTSMLTARAIDNLGIISTSAPISITATDAPPVITSFSPTLGPAGTMVTITGARFHPVATNNIVTFGAVRARITGGTTNTLTVLVPPGATYEPIAVTKHGLMAYSGIPFLLAFGGADTIALSSFAPEVSLASTNGPEDAKIADLDIDGRPDVICANLGGKNLLSLYQNLSQVGTITTNSFAPFVEIPFTGGSYGAATGDLDGDGYPDVAIADGVVSQIVLYRNANSSGGITNMVYVGALPAAGAWPHAVSIADLDLDGRPDLVVPSYNRGSVFLYRNIGQPGALAASSFALPVEIPVANSTFYAAVGDLDGDGRPEIVVPNRSANTVTVLLNQSSLGVIDGESFTIAFNLNTAPYPLHCALVDVDGDSKLDLVLVHSSFNDPGVVSIFRNTSTRVQISFAPAVTLTAPPQASRVTAGDLNGDGKPDLAVPSYFGGFVTVYQNNSIPGNISADLFSRVDGIAPGSRVFQVSVGDIDLDGKPDIVVPHDGGTPPGPSVGIVRNLMHGFGTPPTIAIMAPTNGSSFTSPATIVITAGAEDIDGTVTNVAFYAGDTLLGSVTNSPFNFTWTNVPLRVVAPPCNGDADGDRLCDDWEMAFFGSLASSASDDPDGDNFTNLEEYLGGSNPLDASSRPGYVLTAVATDSSGLSTTSAPVRISVTTAVPQVAIVSPTNGNSFVAPASVWLSAIVSDADNSVGRVEFYAGNVMLVANTNPPYTFTWGGVTTGAYALTARAIDVYGPIVTSAPVNITVSAPLSTNLAVFMFASASYEVTEGTPTVMVTVLNSGDLGGSVNYATLDLSASGGSGSYGDYVRAQGALVFTNGEHSKTLAIGIRDDYYAEPDETFEVRLSNPSEGAILGSPSVTTVTIHDNDAASLTNSLLGIGFPSAVPDRSAQLRVTLPPPEAGGQWRFRWETGWRNGGLLVTNLVADNYEMEFRPIPGWMPESSAALVTVATNAITEFTNRYFAMGASGRGWLTANLKPDNVASNGGWHLAGEGDSFWRASGETLSNLVAGTHLIQFKPVSGLSAPASRSVEVVAGQGTIVTEYYLVAEPLPGGAALPTPLPGINYINESLTYQLPYAFNGQLHSEVGWASGVAVRERVVLTAAHVVFNDQTLSAVQALDWFFQRQAGEYDPKPIRARGWLMLSGYAAARSNDLAHGYSPGQSSPESRNGDVAALFFYRPAARGGYGGYLTSDAGTNEWLVSSRLKMLVGYPVDGASYGYAGVAPGKMHSVLAQNYAFTPLAPRVYATAGFVSFPGNSGGPVYVLHNNGTYYPAGVYLGRLNDQSLVRSIDSNVVSLINQAANQGDAGENYTQGGVVYLNASAGLEGVPIGYVQVDVSPSCASGSAKWWVEGYEQRLFDASDVVAAVAYGYAIHFGAVAGYLAPAKQSVSLASGVTNLITATYQPVSGGYVRVNLGPSYAVSAGARWFLLGEGSLLVSGQTAEFGPTSGTVDFLPLPGFQKPSPYVVSVLCGRTNFLDGYYAPVGVLALSLSNGLTLSGPSGATYRVEYAPSLNGGHVWSNLTTLQLSNGSQPVPGTRPTNTVNRYFRAVLVE